MGLATSLVRVRDGDFMHPEYVKPWIGTRFAGDQEFIDYLHNNGIWEQDGPASWANPSPSLYARPIDLNVAEQWIRDTWPPNWNGPRWIEVIRQMRADPNVWISPSY